MPPEHVDPREFRTLLERDGDERRLAAYLRQHPWITYWTFCTASGHDRCVLHEFPLGSRFKADVVILNSFSGCWEAYLIELEPANVTPFTKDGRPGRRLSAALRQVDDWKAFGMPIERP